MAQTRPILWVGFPEFVRTLAITHIGKNIKRPNTATIGVKRANIDFGDIYSIASGSCNRKRLGLLFLFKSLISMSQQLWDRHWLEVQSPSNNVACKVKRSGGSIDNY